MSAIAPNGKTNVSGSGKAGSFPRTMHLLRHADFERVYKQGRRYFAAHMTVFYMCRLAGEGLRVGFTVSRALGGAVDRNRMRRRLREAVRAQHSVCTVSVDVVINPKKSLLHADFTELVREVGQAFVAVQQKLGQTK